VYAVRVRLFSSSRENCAPAADKITHKLKQESKAICGHVFRYTFNKYLKKVDI